VKAASRLWRELFRRGLLLDILLDDRERRAPARDDAIGPAPENRLAVDMRKLFGEVAADEARGGRLEVVYEFRQVEIGRQIEKHVNVIRLAVELDQFATPILAPLRRDLPQPFENGLCDAFAPILGYDNQVIVQCINTVILLAKLDILAHATKLTGMGEAVNRRVTYKLYPSASQVEAMERTHDLHRQLYNAALEERIDAWRKSKVSVSFAAQCRSLTIIRQQQPEYLALNAQSTQVTLKRLAKAFSAFFRRCKAGETPGFPRFKARDRFSGWGYKSHGDGFRFTPGEGWRHGKLRLSGIGEMAARGEARTPGRVVCADIMRKCDGWYLSLVVECDPRRERGEREVGLDWGVETLATLAYGLDDFTQFENDRPLAAETEALKVEQRALSAALRGKRTSKAAKQRKLMARRWRKIANRRKNRSHQITARLVRDHKLIVTEELAISNMTASARGTSEKPGRNVKQKAGLNRAILDATPGSILSNLAYKAEEAGCEIIFISTRKHKPSQTDPISGAVRKKSLSERTHVLPDGRVIGRDQAAALTMLAVGLRQSGREPAWTRAAASETATQSRKAA
jgi:putative transposase